MMVTKREGEKERRIKVWLLPGKDAGLCECHFSRSF